MHLGRPEKLSDLSPGNQRTASLPRHLKCSREDNVCRLPYRLVSVSIGVLLIYTVY